MHGGASTGPRTPEGLEKSRHANWRHGKRSAERIAARRALRIELRMLILESEQLFREIGAFLRHRDKRMREDGRGDGLIGLARIDGW